MNLFRSPDESADARQWVTRLRRSLVVTAVAAPVLAVAVAIAAVVPAAPDRPVPAGPEQSAAMGVAVPEAGTALSGAVPTGDPAPDGAESGAPTDAEETAENDDELFGDVPVPDEHDGGGIWVPPLQGPTDLATPPRVFDLVAPEPAPEPELDAGTHAVGGLKADVGCAGNCITEATATVGGVDATIEVHTDTPARIWVILDGGIGARDSGNTPTELFTADLDGLTPDTTYHVTLVAEDEHGRANHRYGEIRTQARQVLVTFTSIDVIDDADHGKFNRGEIELFFQVNGDWAPDLHEGKQKIRTGKSVRFGGHGKLAAVTDAPRFLELKVQGLEHDKPAFTFCTHGVPPWDDFDGGDAGPCLDVATASGVVDLDNLTVEDPALPSWHDGYFRIVTENHYLKFAINGAIDVSYG